MDRSIIVLAVVGILVATLISDWMGVAAAGLYATWRGSVLFRQIAVIYLELLTVGFMVAISVVGVSETIAIVVPLATRGLGAVGATLQSLYNPQ